ncbi:transposase [Streptomyces tauricus]
MGGKKINGRRRHVITDSLGLLLMIWVTAANVTEGQAARAMLPVQRTRFRKITLVWADGGCTGSLVTWAKEELQLTLSAPNSLKARQPLRLPGSGSPMATTRRLSASMTTCRFVEYP